MVVSGSYLRNKVCTIEIIDRLLFFQDQQLSLEDIILVSLKIAKSRSIGEFKDPLTVVVNSISDWPGDKDILFRYIHPKFFSKSLNVNVFQYIRAIEIFKRINKRMTLDIFLKHIKDYYSIMIKFYLNPFVMNPILISYKI